MMRTVRQTSCPRCEDVLAALDDQHLPPHDAGIGHPADERDRDVDVARAVPEYEDERDDEDVEGERDDDVHRPVRDRIHRASEVPRDQPDRRAEHKRDEHGEDGDAQVGAHRIDHPRQDVAPELVRPERVAERRPLEAGQEILLDRVVPGDDGGEHPEPAR